MADKCAIWGTPAAPMEGPGGRSFYVYSLRAGGAYGWTIEADQSVRSLSVPDKIKLTTWLVDQRRSGETSPLVKTFIIEEVKTRRLLTFSERSDRFFIMCSTIGVRPGELLKISGIVDDAYKRFIGIAAAWTESKDEVDFQGFLRVLASQGYLEFINNNIQISGKGHQRMEELESVNSGFRQAFVAMWFDPDMDEPYEAGIKPAIERAGYQALRIDAKEHNNKIDDEIILEIRRSRFVVADFTAPVFQARGKTMSQPRGGVYYEAGYAAGLRIPVIWTVREDMLQHVHFDTRQYSHIVWKTPKELQDGLFKRIGATVGLFGSVGTAA